MDYKKYLPSKDFRKKVSVFFGVFLVLFLVFFVVNKIDSLNFERKIKIKETKTVEDYIKKDTDEDGLLDWEEELWGTDKTKKNTFEMPDLQYVENKKTELGLKTEAEFDLNELTETDKFAREFFSSWAALRSSGEVSSFSINNFYNSLGKKISYQETPDVYFQADLNVLSSDTEEDHLVYFEQVRKLFLDYREKGLGDELDIVSEGLVQYSDQNQNTIKSGELVLISDLYNAFALDVLEIGVPATYVDSHLRILNNALKISKSVLNMSKIVSDPIIGLSGVSQYQEESEAFAQAVSEVEAILEE